MAQAAQAKFERMGGPGNPQARQWMAKQMARLQEEVNQETQVRPSARGHWMHRAANGRLLKAEPVPPSYPSSQFILYGVRERGARDRYMARFGCAAWTDEAMEAVARFSPLIEIGAGKGVLPPCPLPPPPPPAKGPSIRPAMAAASGQTSLPSPWDTGHRSLC